MRKRPGSPPSAPRPTTSRPTFRSAPDDGGRPHPARGIDHLKTLDSLDRLVDELPEHMARQAFTHASWVDDRTESWDRLAFLGDVVLSLSVSTEIYPRFDGYGAGELTKLRAQAVNRQACAEVARAIDVPRRLREAAPANDEKGVEALLESDRILASVCEAVIGAAYLCFGFGRVAPAVVEAFEPEIKRAVASPEDFKSVLQERLAQRGQVVDYRVEAEEGPPHDRLFVAVAEVDGREVGRGEGKTKKSAEQEAALEALGREEEG